VRLVPMVFCICMAEDAKAHRILLQIFEEVRARTPGAAPLSDAVLDYACLTSAAEYFGNRRVYLHRCLQHVKTDLAKEPKRRDTVTGAPRLSNSELLKVFTQWIEWSAFLPTDLEFHSFWKEALERMSAQVLDTDFKEPDFAAYLEEHIFDIMDGG